MMLHWLRPFDLTVKSAGDSWKTWRSRQKNHCYSFTYFDGLVQLSKSNHNSICENNVCVCVCVRWESICSAQLFLCAQVVWNDASTRRRRSEHHVHLCCRQACRATCLLLPSSTWQLPHRPKLCSQLKIMEWKGILKKYSWPLVGGQLQGWLTFRKYNLILQEVCSCHQKSSKVWN